MGGWEKNAVCGWRANAPPRAVSEAPAEAAEEGVCAARSRSGAPCFTSTTNRIVSTNQSLLRIRLTVVTSADRGPAMCASPLLSRKTPVSPKLQLSVGRFSTLVISLWARALRGCGAAAAHSESFCHKCQTSETKTQTAGAICSSTPWPPVASRRPGDWAVGASDVGCLDMQGVPVARYRCHVCNTWAVSRWGISDEHGDAARALIDEYAEDKTKTGAKRPLPFAV